jgi:[ribosomal protein S5]-alanine N-acetyltransferase
VGCDNRRVTATLQTDRLDLAEPTAEDAEAIFTIAGDPATVAHNPSDLLAGVADARELVNRWIQHWKDRRFGYWCVREVGQSPVVGYCGLKAMSAHGQPVLNLIYRFSPSVWGRGYATEAAIAAVAWAGQHQPGSTILARVRPANQASQNVAVKAGLRRDPAMDQHGEDGLDLAFTNRMDAEVRS